MRRAQVCELLGLLALLNLPASPLQAAPPATTPTILVEAQAGPGVVNLNSASVEQLMLLPGVGRAKAQAIVARRERGPFTRKEQLLTVRGIGRKTLERLRPYLTVDGPTTLNEKVRGR